MNFNTGCQPCSSFEPRHTTPFAGGARRHECYSPGCEGGWVAFCANCSTDHHAGGYQSCGGTWHDKAACPKCIAAQGGANG